MTTKSLTFVFWLLTPGLLVAQTGQPPAPARPPVQGKQMYEDIEIMRRILNRKLGTWPSLIALNQRCTTCHETNAGWLFKNQGDGNFIDVTHAAGLGAGQGVTLVDLDNDGYLDLYVANMYSKADDVSILAFCNPHNPDPHASLAHWLNTEGVYLKGHGLVYTLTLPPPPPVARPQAKKPASKPMTEWERTRRQIRGDKEESQDLASLEGKLIEDWVASFQGESGHLRLTETILKILAENGHHFSQLPENEHLTVAVTFRDLGQLRGLANQNARPGTLEFQQDDPWLNLQPAQTPGPAAGAGAEPGGAKPQTADKSPSSSRDFQLLADLHLRQGKAREAIKTYQQALNLDPEPKRKAAIYRKIAQADLALEDDAGAKKALEMAQQFLKEQPWAKPPAGGTAKPQEAAPIVSKLIISAPKRLLDQVAAGKVSFHDFEKQVTVDYVGLSTAETKDNKPTPANSK